MNALWLAEAKVFLRFPFLVQAWRRAQPDDAQGEDGSNFGQSCLSAHADWIKRVYGFHGWHSFIKNHLMKSAELPGAKPSQYRQALRATAESCERLGQLTHAQECALSRATRYPRRSHFRKSRYAVTRWRRLNSPLSVGTHPRVLSAQAMAYNVIIMMI